MKYLFYLGHPAHFHLFKHSMAALQARGHLLKVVIKKKDVLEELLQRTGFEYENILPKGRRNHRIAIAASLLRRDFAVYRLARHFRPDLMIGTSAEITHVGRILAIPSVVVNEDDVDVVPLFARMAYPMASHILAPASCRVGRWRAKQIAYQGYHELAYLHPNNFVPDKRIVVDRLGNSKRYFFMRFADLCAHHDVGKSGIRTDIAQTIIQLLQPHGEILITSERPLEPQFEQYGMRINPADMHHFLSYADLYIGDSQTMAAEAAVLGTPSLRFNDFVGQIGYLEELEYKYKLTHGFKTDQEALLYGKVAALASCAESKKQWQERRARMLSENIDLALFMTWLLEGYPDSTAELSNDPELLQQFTGINYRRPEWQPLPVAVSEEPLEGIRRTERIS